jgi:YVTN family beta-propeller protein
VSVFSLPDLAPVATVDVGLAPLAVAVNPARSQVYVVNSLADDMSVIDAPANTVMATVPAGRKPWDVVVSADGELVYVAASASGEILVFSADRLLAGAD